MTEGVLALISQMQDSQERSVEIIPHRLPSNNVYNWHPSCDQLKFLELSQTLRE